MVSQLPYMYIHSCSKQVMHIYYKPTPSPQIYDPLPLTNSLIYVIFFFQNCRQILKYDYILHIHLMFKI